jgi:uncharacterized tellurite resistance protein B-like protein
MIKNLIEFFENATKSADSEPEVSAKSLELAAAILMIEISMADSDFDSEERALIESLLVNEFEVDKGDVDTLIKLAEKEVDHAVSLHDFTRLVNETLSAKEKVKVIEMLWRIAYADAILDKYEEYYIRKIADLLYISHSDYIKAKHLASPDIN